MCGKETKKIDVHFMVHGPLAGVRHRCGEASLRLSELGVVHINGGADVCFC